MRRRVAGAGAALALAASAAAVALAASGPRDDAPARTAASVPAGTLPILMYHRISAAPPGSRGPRLWVPRRRFAEQVAALARAGYRAVTLAQVWRAWHGGGRLPAKPIVLTFDDGFVSQYRNAASVLRARRWPGVLFLQADRVGAPGGLSAAQVRRMLADGWQLGAHTLTHPDLTAVDAQRLRDEVAGSRALLRTRFGVGVDVFAYPYGRVDAVVEEAVRAAGFVAATTIRHGLAARDGDPLRLARVLVDGRSAGVLLARLRAVR